MYCVFPVLCLLNDNEDSAFDVSKTIVDYKLDF